MLGCDQELQGLTGCLIDILCSANGAQASGSSTRSLPMTLREVLPWGVNKPWAQCSLISGANSNQVSELIPFTVTGLPVIRSSSLSFRLRFNASLRAPGSYRHAAKLDTGRVASTYPGGISPRLSIRPCQSARSRQLFRVASAVDVLTVGFVASIVPNSATANQSTVDRFCDLCDRRCGRQRTVCD